MRKLSFILIRLLRQTRKTLLAQKRATSLTGIAKAARNTSQTEALTKEISKEDTVIDALGHEWEDHFTVDKQATAKEDGSKSIHCKHCDAVKEVTVIPATGAANNGDDTPKTGDNNLIALYIGLVVLAAACLTATLVLRKRSTK